MASKEIENAVGAAPARSVKPKSATELLKEKSEELASAGRRYADAKAKRDHIGMADHLRVIEALGVLIRELEQEVAGAVEQDALQRAKERVLGISRAVGSVVASMMEDRERLLESARPLRAVVRGGTNSVSP